MSINIDLNAREKIQEDISAKWKKRGLKYLGIRFPENLQYMIQDNIGALTEKLGKQLKNWVKLPLTWLGRISVIKMNVLP